jgi:quinol monooxygenase YgiN
MIMYNIRLRAHPGRRDDVLAVMRDLAAEAEREPGTLVYLFNTVDDDADAIISYEVFADAGALAIHQASPVLAEAMTKFGDLVASVDAKLGAPAFGKGLPRT